MKKRTRNLLLLPLLIPAGLCVLIVLLLQFGLNSGFARGKILALAEDNLDCSVSVSDLDFSFVRCFPSVRITLDTLSLTYPHDRYAAFEGVGLRSRLLAAGRGDDVDTLARFDRFTAAVNPWRLISGKVRLEDARLHSLRLYAHRYDSLNANWNIFRTAAAEVGDTSSAGASLPWISVGEIRIARSPRIVFTDRQDTLFAAVGFSSLSLKGDVKADLEKKSFLFNGVGFDLDSLRLVARLPADTIAFRLDSVRVDNPLRNMLSVEAGSEATAFTNAFGRLKLPLHFAGRVGYESQQGRNILSVPGLDANLAGIPLSVEGRVDISDKVGIDARASVHDCYLDKLLQTYAHSFLPQAEGISTGAILNLDASASGYLSEGQLPDLKAGASIRSDALDASLEGSAKDIGGSRCRFDLNASVAAVLEKLTRFLPSSLNIGGAGDVLVNLDASVSADELKTFKFRNSTVSGSLVSDHIDIRMPDDTLDASLDHPEIRLGSYGEGLSVVFDIDSLRLRKGSGTRARVREMKNSLEITKVISRGQNVPRIAFRTQNERVFLKSGNSKVGLSGVSVGAGISHVARPDKAARKHFLDSLQRLYPGVPRDSLFHKAFAHRRSRNLPSFLSEKDFEAKDISLSLDSALTAFLRNWKPFGDISVRHGFVATASLPLRTRVSSLSGSFDSDKLLLDTLKVRCGTSDVSLAGEVSGLRRVLSGRKGFIRTGLNIDSRRLNLNELMLAFQSRDASAVADDSDTDEGMVADSLSGVPSRMSLVVLPANVAANVNLNADRVEYSYLKARDAHLSASLRERTLQITDASLKTDAGGIDVDAFYSTKTKKDISIGAGLRLSDISAGEIIRMLPAVDSLMPVLKSFEGKFNCDLSLTARLDTNMNVIMPSAEGLFRIAGENLNVNDAGDLRKITRLLMFRNKNIGHIDNLYVDAVIHNNKLEVFPFELGVDRYKLALRGTQGFDKSMNYHVSVMKMPLLLIPFGINIYGTTDKWKFSLGSAKYKEGKVAVYSKQLDTMQINIKESIRNIYRRGVDNARASHALEVKRMTDRERSSYGSLSSTLSGEQFRQIDSVVTASTLNELEKDSLSEIDEIMSGIDFNFPDLPRTRDEIREERKAARQAARKEKRKL